MQLHVHHLACAVDAQRTEELQALARRPVRLHASRDAEKLHLRAEGRVQPVRAERAGVHRPGDELPERMKVGERRATRIVVVRGAIVHVGGHEDDVADALVAHEREELRDLELASERRPRIRVGQPSKAFVSGKSERRGRAAGCT